MSIAKKTKKSFVSARVSPELKHNTEKLLKGMGMTMTQAMTMVLTDLVENGHWPYVHGEFNAHTLEALETSKRGEGVVSFSGTDAMFKDLHSDIDGDNVE